MQDAVICQTLMFLFTFCIPRLVTDFQILPQNASSKNWSYSDLILVLKVGKQFKSGCQ